MDRKVAQVLTQGAPQGTPQNPHQRQLAIVDEVLAEAAAVLAGARDNDRELRLRWKKLGDGGAGRLADLLRGAAFHRVEDLDLTGCDIDDTGVGALCEVLGRDGRIKTMSLNCNAYRDKGMRSLADLFLVNKGLTTIDLSGSRCTDAGVVFVAKALGEDHCALQTLSLSRSSMGLGMGLGAAEALGAMLATNSTLTSLGLWGCRVGDRGAAALAAGLKGNPTLRTLDVGWNEVGDSGCCAFAAALEFNKTLTKLDLRNNVVGGGGVLALRAVVGKVDATPTEAIVGNVALRELDLGGNPLLESMDLAATTNKFGVPTVAPAWQGAEAHAGASRRQALAALVRAKYGDDTDSDGHSSGSDNDYDEDGNATPLLRMGESSAARRERLDERGKRHARRFKRVQRRAERMAAEEEDADRRSDAAESLLALQALLRPEAQASRLASAEALRVAKEAEMHAFGAAAAGAANAKVAAEAAWGARRAAFLGREYTDKIPERERARLWRNVGDDPRGWSK